MLVRWWYIHYWYIEVKKTTCKSDVFIVCRDMVVAAFKRRPEWEVRVVERAEDDPAEGTATSHLHWGEYEGIDWERVHRGALFLPPSLSN